MTKKEIRVQNALGTIDVLELSDEEFKYFLTIAMPKFLPDPPSQYLVWSAKKNRFVWKEK